MADFANSRPKKVLTSGFPRIKDVEVIIQSNRSNPEAEKRVWLQDSPGLKLIMLNSEANRDMQNLKFIELTEQIINCAFEVHKILGFGFLKKVYENAMLEELKSKGLKEESGRSIIVKYKGNIVGEYFADIVVEDVIIVELKALDKLNDIHELQIKNYLKATGIEVGLLINFGKSVEIKRKYVQNIKAQKSV